MTWIFIGMRVWLVIYTRIFRLSVAVTQIYNTPIILTIQHHTVNEKITAALIAGTISLFVATLSFLSNWLSNQASRQRLYQEIESDFFKFLYKERLEIFSEAFAITGKLRRQKAPQYFESYETLQEIAEELIVWSSGKGGLLMPGSAVHTSRSLIKALRKHPAHNGNYSKDQADKIWQLRTDFRRSLRDGIVHLNPASRSRRESDSN